MKVKYADIHDKMERSRKLLQNAQERIDRQEQVQKTVRNLRQKADLYQSKLNMQKLLKEGVADGTGFDFPQPLINYEEEEAKSGKLSTHCSLLSIFVQKLNISQKLKKIMNLNFGA